jgi:MFS family permease
MMFLQFFIWGAWLPLIFGYLPSLGFSPDKPPRVLLDLIGFLPGALAEPILSVAWLFSEQSLILSAFPIAAIVGMFFSNQFADRNFAAERFLAFSQFVGGVAILSLAWTKSFWPFFGLMLVHCLFYVPTISITNSIAFANLKNAQKDFGPVRLWGTIGWIAAAWPFVFILIAWDVVPGYGAPHARIVSTRDNASFLVTATRADGALDGVAIRLEERASAESVAVNYDRGAKTLEVLVESGNAKASDVVAAINQSEAAGDFRAITLPGNDGSGVVSSGQYTSSSSVTNWFGTILASGLKGEALKEGTRWTYIVSGIASLLLAVFSLLLPHTPPKKAESQEQKLAWLEATKLLKHPFVLVLWVVTLIDAFVHNSYFNWTGQFLGASQASGGVGIPGNWIMPVMSIGQVAEILTMVVLGATLKRLGWRWTMVVGILGHAARFAVYAFFPQHPWMIVTVQVLHGICYAFFFATVYIFVDEFFPKDARASAQGLFNVMILGVGALVANAVCPYLLQTVFTQDKITDFRNLFLVPCTAALGASVLLVVFFHPPAKAVAKEEEGALAVSGN